MEEKFDLFNPVYPVWFPLVFVYIGQALSMVLNIRMRFVFVRVDESVEGSSSCDSHLVMFVLWLIYKRMTAILSAHTWRRAEEGERGIEEAGDGGNGKRDETERTGEREREEVREGGEFV